MNDKIQEVIEHLQKSEELLSQEIEKRKAAEESLIRIRENYILALKEMPVMILATDEDGSIVFYNKEFERISAYTSNDIQNNPEALELLFPDGKYKPHHEPKAGEEWSFYNKDGVKKTIIWSNSKYFQILGWKSWMVGVDITEIKIAQAKIKTLTGLLPICSSCKRIRDDEGYWNQIERYIQTHSTAEFTHSICPECKKKYFPSSCIED